MRSKGTPTNNSLEMSHGGIVRDHPLKDVRQIFHIVDPLPLSLSHSHSQCTYSSRLDNPPPLYLVSDIIYVWSLILTQAGTISVGDFHHVLQEVTNFPLRPFVLPFLKANIPLLARDVAALALRPPPSSAASGCQSTLEYLRYAVGK